MENFLTQTGYNHLWTTSINIRCFHGFILELSISIIVKQNSIYLPSYGYFWAAASIKKQTLSTNSRWSCLGKSHISSPLYQKKLNSTLSTSSSASSEKVLNLDPVVFVKWTPSLDFKNLNQELRNIHLKSTHLFCTLNNLFSSCN